MISSGYEQRRKLPLIRGLMLVNLLLGGLVIVAWQMALLIILDPMSWATAQSFSQDKSWMNLFTYPLALFWITPTLAVLTSWAALKSRRYAVAAGVAFAPVVVALLTIAIYWIAPKLIV